MEAESQWQGWNDFLRYKADNFGLAPTETEAFVKSFIRENLNKTVRQMTNDSNDAAYIKAMQRVYDKFKIEGGRGKRERFLKQLENEYFQSKFPSESFNDQDVEITHVIDKLRDRCIELFNKEKLLTTNSLIAKQGMTFKIDDLFVPLGLVERQRPSKRQDIDSAELGSRLYQPTENGKNTFDDQQQFFDQVIRDCNTPNSKGRRIAIIGEAGAGKTTLLQKIGDQLIHNNYIPIWISLKRLGNQTLDQYLIEDWLRNAAQVLDTVSEEWKTALEELLKTQQVFLLLDGVDEMTATSPLQKIGEQINQFNIFDFVQVILTCRFNLWEDYALPGFDAYRNL
ncbi:MAG: NACHT domain-containing protein, partial [Planktothrix agardhii]